MNCKWRVGPLCFTACLILTPLSWAQTTETASQLSESASFSELKSKIGREPDRSEAGGACGGIVIHDWISENIRVVTLGEIVESVTESVEEADAQAKR